MKTGDNVPNPTIILTAADGSLEYNDKNVTAEHIGEQIGEHHERLTRAKKVARTLTIVAYISMFFDAAIAIVTLVSLHMQTSLQTITTILNYGLTVIIVIAFVLFVILVALSKYEKVIDEMIMINTRLKDHFSARENGETKSKKQK